MLFRRADGVATVWSLINAADLAIGERITELTILGQFSQLGDIGKDRFPLSARARMKVEPLNRNRRWRVMMLLHQLHRVSETLLGWLVKCHQISDQLVRRRTASTE